MKKLLILTVILFTSIFALGQNQTEAIKIAPETNNEKTGNTYITYKNGKIKESGKYDQNGKQTGEWKFYTQSGDLESIGQYANGEKHGEWNDYYSNGKLLRTGNYQNGKQIGEWKTYHVNGQLASVVKYTNGKQIGKTELYNLQGKNTTQKALDNEIKYLMKVEFKKFYTSLQQKNFDQAVNFVSEDYLEATRFSKEQMKNMLQSNFDNWEILPDLKVVLKEIETTKPKKIIKQGNKTFGVLEAIMNFEMTVTGNYSKKEIASTVGLIETIGKDRYKMGEMLQKEGVTVIYIKDKRLVAAIYDYSTQKVRFAMAEMGLKYSFQQFLPKEIIEEMKNQL
ncbi:MORN repeat variant [Paenimyroides ummariense]|uniref:MORN repeat variant n=1 Tax=Paenimyroides ummariense TaxID=913024 RepID=A0A1I4ZKH2_9FLAO|nr:toxin-antitoxin system YwqK family antitoxin [Paenimyroides ummariense]SFN50755.1 MORN repeat variant [Paenimyroides ummariense]